ncbi:MAG: hypothetical protein NXH75_13750 [Halobacteriovoraceae bacterium]|nr:hypothetical protein [Halobacteriovoraceae bacterium]
MKLFPLIITILYCIPTTAYRDIDGPIYRNGEYRFRIQEAKRVPDFDYAYDLKTILAKEHLVLDCQSFIQGLHIYWDGEAAGGVLLSEMECQYIAYHVFTTLGQNQDLCLKINPDNWNIKVGDDPDSCFR